MFHDFDVASTKLFTWTQSARSWQTDASNVHAIGAPWLYLTKGKLLVDAQQSSAPLFMPRHGTRISGAGVDHHMLAEAYAHKYGKGRVLLHADDAHEASTVEAWSSAGHEVNFSKSRFDPDFLVATWQEMSKATVVISDGISTSLLYAASLGVETEISDDVTALPWLAKYDHELRETFPEFYRSNSLETRRNLALSELGSNNLRSADELAELLSLDTTLSISAGAKYWGYSPVRKVLKVLSSSTATESALADSHWTDWLRRPLENVPRSLPKLRNSSVKKAFSS